MASWKKILAIFDPHTFSHSQGQTRKSETSSRHVRFTPECVAKLLEGVPGGFPSASCRNLDSQTSVLGIVIPHGAAVGF